jgi:hypothetical protein
MSKHRVEGKIRYEAGVIHIDGADWDTAQIVVLKGDTLIGRIYRHPCGEVVWASEGNICQRYFTLIHDILPIMADFELYLVTGDAVERGWTGNLSELQAYGGIVG